MRPFFEHLKSFSGNTHLVGAEIGVSIGTNADDFLNGLNINHAYLVDSYPIYTSDCTVAKQKQVMEQVVQKYNRCNNATMIVKDSQVAADGFGAGFFDFVYIDANHRYENVLADIESWYSKVKSNGLIGGHDFDSCEDNHGVYRAVMKWLSLNPMPLFVHHSDWWVIKP